MRNRSIGCQTLVGWLVAGAAVGPGASRAAEPFTPEHVARTRSVTSAAMSPDGRYVAYTLSAPRKPFIDEDGPNWEELHLVAGDEASRPFVTGEVNVSSVKWKPDGKALSFLAKRGKDKTRSLYVIAVDGGEAGNVLSLDTDISEYTWSPDGMRVAVVAAEKEPKEVKDRKDKGFKQEIYEEDFDPVKVWIATPGDGESKPRALDLPGFPSDIQWSPQGVKLAVAIAPTPLVDDSYMRRKLMVFNAESGAIVSSFQNPGKLGDLAWSPDGSVLAVISAEDINDPAEGRLLIADPVNGTLKDILPQYEGHVTRVAWQDKDTVMFLGAEGAWTTFNEIGRDGSGRKAILPSGQVTASRFSLSADGQSAAFVMDSPQHPAELYLMRHGDPQARRVTHSNPWLSKLALAPQAVVPYKARDGLALEGILIRPLNEDKGTRYPLIVRVHGGPEAHDHNGWLTGYGNPGQVAAAKGFAVFYPNYRGSTGRGVAFSKMGQADPAGKEFDDLVDAVDHLIGMGLVDKDKVGITGGSYGGYATAWCSTYYSERFAAGVMFVGISNKLSKSGTTDIPDEEMLVHALKRPWDDWDHFLERSPIFHVQKARTPLLIMHGKDDPRVPASQASEMHRHLKTLGQAPVRLVWYPGEGHGNRKAAAKYDYNLRMMQWFEHYLQGPGGPPPPFEIAYPLKPADEKS
jgi:dipeptidyl aminopeptidase/acylaminoacyl peptidase